MRLGIIKRVQYEAMKFINVLKKEKREIFDPMTFYWCYRKDPIVNFSTL